jgi:transcription elongation factor
VNEEKPAHFTPKTRPAARLLNPAELREMGEYIERRQEPVTSANCIFFSNNFYKNGFLYKTMRISNVIVDGVGATLSEVEKFQQRIAESDDEADDQEQDEDLLEACRTVSAAAQEHGPRFAKGNYVKVIRGDLKHLTGVVMSIVDDKVTMLPVHEVDTIIGRGLSSDASLSIGFE